MPTLRRPGATDTAAAQPALPTLPTSRSRIRSGNRCSAASSVRAMERSTPELPVVYLHGAGRPGRASWPKQVELAPVCMFLDRHPLGDEPRRDAARLVEAVAPVGHAVGASYGGIGVLLAAAAEPDVVRSVVLFEPACFAVARGRPGVELHIATFRPVFDVAGDPNVSWQDWSGRFARATGMPVPQVGEEVLRAQTQRLRTTVPPWEVAVDRAVVAAVPTLVVTGGWSNEYEDVASVLAAAGARHVVVGGQGHRPQDHDDANRLLLDHWAAAEAGTAA